MQDISVIIPAHNRAGLIGETLRSLLNQTLPAQEIIVVDDGSTDSTAEAVEREFSVYRNQFSGGSESKIQHPTFKIIRQSNAGPGAARNRGFAESTGEFIHFFDSDDIAAPNKHEIQLKALLETGADIAYGPWVKGRFVAKDAQTVARSLTHGVARGSLPMAAKSARVAGASEATESNVASLYAENTRNPQPVTRYPGFHPEGPVLQAKGLPKGNLVKALLTSWSVVPHACMFRRSIVEKIGGFPEDLFGTEDQMMFLRCLLAGAKVVHSPGTIEFYRVGDPSKITATGAAQKRHAKEWARFLIKANEEVASGEWRVASESRSVPTEERKRGGEEILTTEDTESTEDRFALNQGGAWASQAGAEFSNPSTSELARHSENTSLTRCASLPASSLATCNPLLVTTTPSAWFGFRLRAYHAWRDLRVFFPGEYRDLESGLERIWKRNRSSFFNFQFSAFLFRIWGGLKQRAVGHRWSRVFRTESCNRSKWFA